MARHTEPESRLAGWQVVALASVGIALGLWHVGAFDRPAAAEVDATGGAALHAGERRDDAAGTLAPAHTRESIVAVDDPGTVVPAAPPGSAVNPGDLDVQAESAARLDALASELAYDP